MFFSKLTLSTWAHFSPITQLLLLQAGSPVNLTHFFTFTYQADKLQSSLGSRKFIRTHPLPCSAYLGPGKPNAWGLIDILSDKGGGCSKTSWLCFNQVLWLTLIKNQQWNKDWKTGHHLNPFCTNTPNAGRFERDPTRFPSSKRLQAHQLCKSSVAVHQHQAPLALGQNEHVSQPKH